MNLAKIFAASLVLLVLAWAPPVLGESLSILPDGTSPRGGASVGLGQGSGVGCLSPRRWPGARRIVSQAGPCGGSLTRMLQCSPGLGAPGTWVEVSRWDERLACDDVDPCPVYLWVFPGRGETFAPYRVHNPSCDGIH